ncbi:MAG: FkbM family methyltransferase [Bryobacteraceae bacterium]|nr:FkbM family methyltransferase [Bryobacteraceae bacterium]MDW8377684.1 FkbM family methyltransferase [Bryobacterales bacterium]
MTDIFQVFVNGYQIRLPARCRNLPGVHYGHRAGIYFEPYMMLAFELLLEPGDTVYDVGCCDGVLSAVLARMVGPRGRVEAFEANPAVVAETGPILALNSQPLVAEAAPIRLHPVCVGERSGTQAEFFVLPAPHHVASTRNPEIGRFHARWSRVEAPLVALDDFVETTGSRPNLIKLDIEGGECAAIRGSQRLLIEHGPAWVIETHGREIDGVQGSLAELVGRLADCGYGFADLVRGELVPADVFVRRRQSQLGYLLALKELKQTDLSSQLKRRWRQLVAA